MKTFYHPFAGGLDVVTPPLEMNPGRAIDAVNFEALADGGDKPIMGFERFDGRGKPSEATYWVLRFETGTTEITVGQTVTGASSGKSGVVLSVTVESGVWGVDAAGYLVLAAVTGEFTAGEDLQVSAVTVAVAVDVGIEGDAIYPEDIITRTGLAAEYARALIGAVPGSGPVRGVCGVGGKVYAFRDNAGATALVLHEATASGWVAKDLGERLMFTGGTVAFTDGCTVTQGAVSATVGRVVVLSGDWGTSNAAGYLVIRNRAGGSFTAAAISGTPAGTATATGAQVTNTLSPGGRVESFVSNFFASSGSRRAYGCDGVNYAWEWDGTTFVPIITGKADDKPVFIKKHAGFLFLGFRNGYVLQSATLSPYVYTAIAGAVDWGVGDDLAGFSILPGAVLGMVTRSGMHALYGTNPTDWQKKEQPSASGGEPYSVQNVVGRTFFLSQEGVAEYNATQSFGDFKAAAITADVEPIIKAKRGMFSASLAVRSKDQYRLFFSDGSGLYITFNGNKVAGIMPVLLPKVVKAAYSLEDENRAEQLFFTSDDGYVYQMDAGYNADGEALNCYLRLAFNHCKSPTNYKRFVSYRLELDATATPTANLQFAADLSYGDPDVPMIGPHDITIIGGGGFWGQAVWGQFLWSSQPVATATAYIDGIGTNFGLLLNYEGTYGAPPGINGGVLTYDVLGAAI